MYYFRIYKRISKLKKSLADINLPANFKKMDNIEDSDEDIEMEPINKYSNSSSNNNVNNIVSKKRKRDEADEAEEERKELQRKRQARLRGKDTDWLAQQEQKKNKNVSSLNKNIV